MASRKEVDNRQVKKSTGAPDLRAKFVSHLRANLFWALVLIVISLAIGMAGYHWLAPMNWTDAFLNASMLLGGMGPVDPLNNDGAKLFAGGYALYCGVVFLATAGLVIAPVGTHMLHRFHLDQEK
jgi:hypothetical protein